MSNNPRKPTILPDRIPQKPSVPGRPVPRTPSIPDKPKIPIIK
jgi:hypothetical protein